jgi:hypothetical protein
MGKTFNKFINYLLENNMRPKLSWIVFNKQSPEGKRFIDALLMAEEEYPGFIDIMVSFNSGENPSNDKTLKKIAGFFGLYNGFEQNVTKYLMKTLGPNTTSENIVNEFINSIKKLGLNKTTLMLKKIKSELINQVNKSKEHTDAMRSFIRSGGRLD